MPIRGDAETAWYELEHKIFGMDKFYQVCRRGWMVADYQLIRQIAAWEKKHKAEAPFRVVQGAKDDEYILALFPVDPNMRGEDAVEAVAKLTEMRPGKAGGVNVRA